MSEIALRMIEDLRRYSGHLLESGMRSKRGPIERRIDAGTEGVLLGAVRAMCALVPRLLGELESGDGTDLEVRRSWTATRARLSKTPRDWRLSDGRLVPDRWLRSEPTQEADPRALAWLLHLVESLALELSPVRQRTERYIAEARASLAGASAWARQDLAGLESIQIRLRSAALMLERTARSILLRTGGPLRARVRSPSPFPRGLAWSRVRELAADIEDRERTLSARIADLLDVSAELADEPLLYQRWCGMRIIEGFADLGWLAEGDFIGALYLAGNVSFRKADSRITLWIENRFSRRGHSTGFQCVRGADATPDFLIVTPGAGGLDAFVLDATKSTDQDVLAAKRRYLDLLQGDAPAMIAGVVSGPRRPLRSWAAAPIDLGHCQLATQSGTSGVVPMHPLAWNPAPLRAWLSDVDRHARAWS